MGEATIHFDGTKWTAFSGARNQRGQCSNLLGVADISPTDAWAAGNISAPVILGGGPTNQPAIEHWDGTQRSVFPSPPFKKPRDSALLSAMPAISANDIWILGNATVNDIGAICSNTGTEQPGLLLSSP